jgi:hypothetical protein
MADPFISPLGLTEMDINISIGTRVTLSGLLLTNNTSVILEVEEDTVSASPCLALSDDDSWVDCDGARPQLLASCKSWNVEDGGIYSPFFRRSGFPFLTVARTISPAEAAGSLFKRDPDRVTAMMYKFLAPLLSQQFMTAPTGCRKADR